jgi:LuxR family maltose regulon positive regulatory protein
VRTSAEATWAHVLSYKFVAPAAYTGAIRREAILQRVARSSSASVILLQGPAGHGKSTALQQLKDVAEADGQLTGWLTFDQGDNDPRRLFMHFHSLVTSVLMRAGDASRSEADDRDISSYRHRSDWLLDRLAKVGRPIALFLDEFQTLVDKTILSFFRSLFERAPDGLRIYVGSRSLPDVGLARLVVNNRALILRGDDLLFSPQEVERFFAGAEDLGINPDEIDAIYQCTEGWPAALQLFRLTLNSPLVRKSLSGEMVRAPSELAEYLAENVLALQPQRIQEFLLRTSELTRLSAPLCDEVLGCTDSREVLLQLERSGMFLRCVDPQGGWFKYHTLFSSALAEQLRLQSAEAADQIHRRAAQWYMKHGFYEETVRHATICHEHQLAADALNQWSSGLVADAHLRTVEYWSDRIPFAEIAARPDLAIKCAYALVFLRRRQRAKPLLELLRHNCAAGSVLATTDPNVVLSMAAISADDIPEAFAIVNRVPLHQQDAEGFAAFELGAAANLRGYCALAAQEFESARDHLALARVYNDHVDAAFSRGYTIAVSGVTLIMQGALRESLERFKEGLAEQRVVIDKSFASAALFSCYVWALYEANHLEMAESLFVQNQDIISDSTLPDFLTVAYLSFGRAHDARGRFAKAESILEEAEAIGHDSGWARLVSTVKWERVRRALLRGDTGQAIEAGAAARVERVLSAGWIPFANDVEDQELGEIRLALARADFDEAQARIQAEFARQRGRVLRQIKLWLLLAVHATRCGEPGAANRHLRSALRLAQAGGFVRPFLDEGGEILQLLRERYQSLLDSGSGPRRPDAERDFVEVLLKASGTDLGRNYGASQAALLPLTDREREMLVLLANGISNKDMANRLFVSDNTVKFHLKNIYAKLSVASRVQAITAARQNGIIH